MAECQNCNHSAPDTCVQCGGKYGYPSNQYPQLLPPCQSCNIRGPRPAEMVLAVYSYLMVHPDDRAALNTDGMSLMEWLESHPEQVAVMYLQWNLG